MRDAVTYLAPIVGVIAFFQLVVLRAPFPNLAEVAVGMLCVVAGLAAEAATVAADAGFIQATEAAQGAYAFHLRMVVAASVGAAIVLGVLRILKG